MRIYEFAHENNLSSKDVVDLLQEAGFDLKNHMSVLDEKALAFLTELTHEDEEIQAAEVGLNKGSGKKTKKPLKIHDESQVEVVSQLEPLKKIEQTKPSLTSKIESKKIELVLEAMSVGDVAEKMVKPVTEVIVTLLKWGIVATKNQVISEDIVRRLAEHYQISIVKRELVKEEAVNNGKKSTSSGELKERLPVVVVMGHVDHGKTTLLDYIRKTRVALKEKGGITQHLGAYEAVTPQGNITFLDTPGHEAFGKIRQRGAKVADIVILVVAADDGVMPQTVEAIKHAQAMNVPVIVAINKVDRAEPARLEVVKRQLSQHGLMPEEWGGDTICLPISAKLGTGVDKLIEMIILQAQMMELRADVKGLARGYILESRLEKGRGPVATVICQHGVLHIGDSFISGETSGTINSLVDSHGKRINQVSPSIPVQVAGFNNLPGVGDYFEVVPKEEYLKFKSAGAKKITSVSKRLMHEGGINLVLKFDTHSSQEAIVESIDRLSKRLAKGFNILLQDVGDISEGDIEFAFNTGATIIGFNVKAETNAQTLADRRKVTIEFYGIIYKLLEALEAKVEATKEVEMVRTKVGEATVLRVFDIKNVGVIAGCIVRDGRFTRDGHAVIFRRSTKIGEGKIQSLQREKKTVKEVFAGFECGFIVDGFVDWQVDDRVECYVDMPKK